MKWLPACLFLVSGCAQPSVEVDPNGADPSSERMATHRLRPSKGWTVDHDVARWCSVTRRSSSGVRRFALLLTDDGLPLLSTDGTTSYRWIRIRDSDGNILHTRVVTPDGIEVDEFFDEGLWSRLSYPVDTWRDRRAAWDDEGRPTGYSGAGLDGSWSYDLVWDPVSGHIARNAYTGPWIEDDETSSWRWDGDSLVWQSTTGSGSSRETTWSEHDDEGRPTVGVVTVSYPSRKTLSESWAYADDGTPARHVVERWEGTVETWTWTRETADDGTSTVTEAFDLSGKTAVEATWTFDADGRLVDATDGTGTTTYSWDPDTGALRSVSSRSGSTTFAGDCPDEIVGSIRLPTATWLQGALPDESYDDGREAFWPGW